MKLRKKLILVIVACAIAGAVYGGPFNDACNAWDIFGWFDWLCNPT